MRRLAARLLAAPVILYALSVAFGKGLVLVTLPFLTHGLAPAEFVRLDMAASLIEPIGLIGCLAIAETLFRFAPQHPEGRATLARALTGMALTLGLPLVLLTQLILVPLVAPWPNMPGELALRLALLLACLGAFIELPLAFWRLSEQPLRFTAFVIGRSLAQAALLIGGLKAGFGVDGVLIGNAVIDGLVILLLWRLMPSRGLPVIRLAGLTGHIRYAVPILGGGLAMFALGAMDRWFLAGRVDPDALAHYALATKLAMALALAIQPFGLWWYPRRLAVLRGPDGPQETARYWLAGLALLCLGAVVLMALARLFVLGIFPPAYHGVLAYLPWLFALVLMNELASLSNGPAYARDSGWHVLRVNGAGAIMALALYLLLIPGFGLVGAMAATACGQVTRLVLFWADRGLGARIPYRLPLALVMMAAALSGMITLAGKTAPDGSVPLALGLAIAIMLLVLVRTLLPAGLGRARLALRG
jgi:O-antigen/teichoic acid export membrane protein